MVAVPAPSALPLHHSSCTLHLPSQALAAAQARASSAEGEVGRLAADLRAARSLQAWTPEAHQLDAVEARLAAMEAQVCGVWHLAGGEEPGVCWQLCP